MDREREALERLIEAMVKILNPKEEKEGEGGEGTA